MHLDGALPGDRASKCFGLMEPIDFIKGRKQFQVVHRCTRCGKIQPNRIARDTVQADDFETLVKIMQNAHGSTLM